MQRIVVPDQGPPSPPRPSSPRPPVQTRPSPMRIPIGHFVLIYGMVPRLPGAGSRTNGWDE
eukprot:280696-Rhodomonas_salina.1